MQLLRVVVLSLLCAVAGSAAGQQQAPELAAESAAADAARLAEIDRELAQFDSAEFGVAPGKASVAPEWWTNQNAMTVSAVVLIFGLVVIIICARLMHGSRPSSEAILRVFGTVLIITGALFLVVAGYTDKQMAPVMGLLGTLAGYLLGKSPGQGDVENRDGKTA